ncbi:hypothetical protein GIB67_006604 [Kingdonia uniflora]|uniref:Uncharacterized protein n=1 Tax=Kingdonia uniflora TaxID=39325 RepID=A0A7J7LF33_9MAGN|nr:hypothetical protein GIB67_006604 [Kingdonia uniflora]
MGALIVSYLLKSVKELAGSRLLLPLSELRTAEEAAAVESEVSGLKVEGEAHPDGTKHPIKPVGASLTEAEELDKYITVREEMYMKAKEFDSKIVAYETTIRRPYFHVVKLYERCLITCANYSEYWIRYVLCMKASGSMDLANNVLARATQVFAKRQLEIHLFAARFKEQNGDIPGSRAAYQLLQSGICPGLLEPVIKHTNMEYR